MKNTRQCPKCQSKELLRIPAKLYCETGNIILSGMFSEVGVTRYLCSHCGFSEEWIDDPKAIAALKKAYPD